MKWRRDEPEPLSRKAFLKLRLEERRRILEAQAGKLREYYAKEEDWKETETDEIHDFTTESFI
jgi:hypothetical protein